MDALFSNLHTVVSIITVVVSLVVSAGSFFASYAVLQYRLQRIETDVAANAATAKSRHDEHAKEVKEFHAIIKTDVERMSECMTSAIDSLRETMSDLRVSVAELKAVIQDKRERNKT